MDTEQLQNIRSGEQDGAVVHHDCIYQSRHNGRYKRQAYYVPYKPLEQGSWILIDVTFPQSDMIKLVCKS